MAVYSIHWELLSVLQQVLTENMGKRNLYVKNAEKYLSEKFDKDVEDMCSLVSDPEELDPLAIKFEEEIRAKMLHAKKECRYNPTRFNQMIAKYGGVETAKRLIANALQTGNTSDGFTTLCLYGRLDLTMENSVCKPEYQSLFSPEEIAYCKEVLG